MLRPAVAKENDEMRAMTYLAFAAFVMGAPASAERFEDLQLVYHATFANGSLKSPVDPLPIGPLTFDNSGEAGINPSWTPAQGDYRVEVTRPISLLRGPPPVRAGFDADVNFDVGSVVGLRATFVAPVGPHNSNDVWAVVVNVETGGANPVGAAASLRIEGATALFTTPGATVQERQPVSSDDYDAIFRLVDPEPFTLEFLVDRVTGRAEASLKIGDKVYSRTYELSLFRADSGPPIGAVGPDIAIIYSSGEPASVRIRDFQIFAGKLNSEAVTGDPLCPPEFGCRVPPN